MIILLAFAFLAGIVTILSPCILPILPIVLSGSVGGSHKKPIGIILGFIVSFTFFTLFLTTLVKLTGISADLLRYIAAGVLLLFGVSLLIPQFQLITEKLFTKLSVFTPKANPNAGFWGGFLIGLSIGLIWTPCVGPILASVIALAATSKVNTITFLITFAYALGSGIPMFFIMIGGRKLLSKAPLLIKNGEVIQKAFGVLMILLAFMIYLNLDRQFEAYIASTPYGANLTSLEQNDLVTKQLDILKGKKSTQITDTSSLFNQHLPAPDFVGITKWLNLPDGKTSLNLADLRGKVVLVDFWTYTCINCIRTLPHVTSWYDKYKDQGFVVIGVHTPEFQFEHNTANVENAIKMYNIHYPVAQDNDYATWNNYSNQYWPAEYLIDAKGEIRRTEFGEGEYDQTEMAIQALLKESGEKVSVSLDSMPDTTPTGQISPETYVGASRMEFYYPTGSTGVIHKNFDLGNPTLNSFSLGGNWNIANDNAITGDNAVLLYHFYAGKVFLVLRPPAGQTATIKVLLDGKVVGSSNAGSDVKDGVVTIDTDRLYNLIDLKGKIEDHILRLEFQTPGTQVFAFTFGAD